MPTEHIDGLFAECSDSSALAMELLQSCNKSSIWYTKVRRAPALKQKRQNVDEIVVTGFNRRCYNDADNNIVRMTICFPFQLFLSEQPSFLFTTAKFDTN